MDTGIEEKPAEPTSCQAVTGPVRVGVLVTVGVKVQVKPKELVQGALGAVLVEVGVKVGETIEVDVPVAVEVADGVGVEGQIST
jgi:hypothetical protein